MLKLNYALNVKSNAENPANQALFSDYSSIVRDSVKPPLGFELREYFNIAQINLDCVKPLVRPIVPLAMFCGIKIILELAEYPKDEMLPSVFRTKFLELKDRFYSNFLHVYTDGSKKEM